jgi:hypothetical protein
MKCCHAQIATREGRAALGAAMPSLQAEQQTGGEQ